MQRRSQSSARRQEEEEGKRPSLRGKFELSFEKNQFAGQESDERVVSKTMML